MRSPDAPPSRQEVAIASEHDVIHARTDAKRLADTLGFSIPDAVKVATVVSELARNIVNYAREGSIELEVVDTPRKGIRITAIDHGPGIPDVEHILSGKYRSRTGMGLGLVGSKRLVDQLEVDSAPGRGTKVVAHKFVERR
ncbi:MAG: Anti-sigma factor RsbT [Labilithrix sp.]|nr:Anti-sigma factor RsbT [Labilithrix sp.]